MADVDYGPFTSEGLPCVATRQVTESGKGLGDPEAMFPSPMYIHAETGESGVVVGLDPACGVTVRFNRTGTATLVGLDEVALAS